MPTVVSHLRWELLSGKKRKAPDTNHDESWLVANWPDYVERMFEKAPDHMMHQLRKMVEDKKTPKVEAHKVRGQTVKPIDSRPPWGSRVRQVGEAVADLRGEVESLVGGEECRASGPLCY